MTGAAASVRTRVAPRRFTAGTRWHGVGGKVSGPAGVVLCMKLGLSRLPTALLAASIFTLSVAADAKLTRDGDAKVTFTSTGPGGLKFDGTTSDLKVADDGKNVTITVPLGNLVTGIDLRDKHMKEKYLEVGKFADATLVVSRASLKVGEGEGDAQGTLKLHGVEKPFSFHYAVKKAGDKLAVDARGKLNMKEHGVDVPSYLGVTVKPEVEVKVSFVAADK